MVRPARARVAPLIDHTLLDPGATGGDIDRLCDEAAAHGFAAACVLPWWIARAAARLDGAAATCTVVAFPHGLDLAAAKADAARRALAAGADEVDVVLAWGALGDDEAAASRDAAAVVEAARRERAGAVVKLIVETARLDDARLAAACRVVAASGADFAKTSTGVHGGATPAAVAALRAALPAHVAIKASGGIRTAAAAAALLRAGAARLGTSAGPAIVEELEAHAVA
jgi:deoxyribose-phosphate aldolase